MLSIPYVKIDNCITCTWITPDRQFALVVSRDEILKISLRQKDSVVVLQLRSAVVSAWLNNEDTSLVLLTRLDISVIDTNRWTVRKELKLPEEHVQTLQAAGDDKVWIAAIPSVWSSRVRTKSTFLYVVGCPSMVLVMDINTGKVFTRRERDLSRGQYLSQFLSLVTDSVQVTPLSSVVSLVSSSLSCSFIKSSLRDLVISRTSIVILAANGDVWKVPRMAANKTKSLLMTDVTKLCLLGEDLTMMTTDGSVYCLDLSNHNNSRVPVTMKLKKNENISEALKSQVKTLSRVGALASQVDLRLEQIQLYQYLLSTAQHADKKIFSFESELSASQKLLHVRLGLSETNFRFSGSDWFMKVELCSRPRHEKKSVRLTLPKIFSSSTEKISTCTSVDMTGDSLQVRVYLIFHTEQDKTRAVHLPAIKVAERDFELSTERDHSEHEENFVRALGLSKGLK